MPMPADKPRPSLIARRLRTTLVGQFRQPHGLLGRLAGWVMTRRASNVRRSAWTVELLEVKPKDRVLEVGCGPGLALADVARRAQSGLIVGIDHSQLMVRAARRRNKAAISEGRVIVRHGDVNDVTLLGTAFDKVFCVNVAMFFADPVAAFRSLRATLIPGGILAVTNQPRNAAADASDAVRAADMLQSQLEKAGFLEIQRRRLDIAPVPAICLMARSPKP